LDFEYLTQTDPEKTNSISLDDIILTRTELEPVLTGFYRGSTPAKATSVAIVGGQYSIVLSDPIPNNATVDVYVGNLKAVILSKNGKLVTFKFPNTVGANKELTVKINGISMGVPIKIKSIPNLIPIFWFLLR
jgi:hypothetical protein